MKIILKFVIIVLWASLLLFLQTANSLAYENPINLITVIPAEETFLWENTKTISAHNLIITSPKEFVTCNISPDGSDEWDKCVGYIEIKNQYKKLLPFTRITEPLTFDTKWSKLNIRNLSYYFSKEYSIETVNESVFLDETTNYTLTKSYVKIRNFSTSMPDLKKEDGFIVKLYFEKKRWETTSFDLLAKSGLKAFVLDPDISACGTLDVDGATYTLTHNVNSSGPCFTIGANNLTLDGQSYTVTYSQSSTGYAIYDKDYSNITIKNLNIIQGGTSSYSIAINFDNSIGSRFTNNTISTKGYGSHGMRFDGRSTQLDKNHRIFNNIINTTGSEAHGIYPSANSFNFTVGGNTINTPYGLAWYIYPLTASGDNYNHTVYSNNTEQGKPIYYYYKADNQIIENLDVGELMVTVTENVTIRNITATKDPIYLTLVKNSSIYNNTATVYGNANSGYAIQITGASRFNKIYNNIGITYGSSQPAGMYVYLSSNYNTIYNNILKSYGTGTSGSGVYISKQSNYNNFINNTLIGYGDNNNGVKFYNSSYNTFTNDNIIGGSIGYDYKLQTISDNSFSTTNFTTSRRIYFNVAQDVFNYSNSGGIWLRTYVSAGTTLTRTHVNWSSTLTKWNDTSSTSNIVASYAIAGLLPNTVYNIYNISQGVQSNPYILVTDNNGNLPSFSIALNGSTQIIVKTDSPQPPQPPGVTSYNPITPVNDIEVATRMFNVTFNQPVNITWYLNGTVIQTNNSVTNASYTNTSAGAGTWNITASGTNSNGSASQVWTWIVYPLIINLTGYFYSNDPGLELINATITNGSVEAKTDINGHYDISVLYNDTIIVYANFTKKLNVHNNTVLNFTFTSSLGTP